MSLPPAVPPFQPDVDTAYSELGKSLAYIKQLTNVIQERAREANDIHDKLLAAQDRVVDLEKRVAELEGYLND